MTMIKQQPKQSKQPEDAIDSPPFSDEQAMPVPPTGGEVPSYRAVGDEIYPLPFFVTREFLPVRSSEKAEPMQQAPESGENAES